MGISTTTNRVSFVGDGSSATFAFPYEFFAQSELKVYFYNSSAQSQTLQTLNTNYSVGGTPNLQGVYTSGGQVITTCAVPSGMLLVVYRDLSPVQNYELLQNGQINSVALVNQLDYMTLLVQRLQDQASRSVRLAEGYAPTFDTTLPPVALYANACILFNSSATGFAVGPTAAQIINSEIFANTAASSAVAAAASAVSAAASAVLAGSAAVSSTNQAVLAASAAVSASNSVGLVGSTAFWGLTAQSSALSATNQTVLANSAAVSASNQAVLAGSAAVSASNQAVLAGSAAVSAGNQTVLANSAALSASNSVAVLGNPVGTPFGGTGTGSSYAYTQYGVIFMSSATQMAGTSLGGVGTVLMGNGSSAPSFQNIFQAVSSATKTAAYNMTTADSILYVNSSNYTVNTFAPSGNAGRSFIVKKGVTSGSSAVIIAGSSCNIEGVANIQLAKNGDFLHVVCDGSNFFLVSSKISATAHFAKDNGYGSTNNKIAKFVDQLEVTGNAFTVANDATNGFSATINIPGTYSFSLGASSSGVMQMGFSLNSNQLTTSIGLINSSAVLANTQNDVLNDLSLASWTGPLAAGDVVRPHTDGTSAGASPERTHLWVTRLN